jgi:hypothetical protein
MVRVSFAERARLLADESHAYYVTEHYAKHPAVLVRLSRVSRQGLRDLLGSAWLFVSEKAESRGNGRTSLAKRRRLPRTQAKR